MGFEKDRSIKINKTSIHNNGSNNNRNNQEIEQSHMV